MNNITRSFYNKLYSLLACVFFSRIEMYYFAYWIFLKKNSRAWTVRTSDYVFKVLDRVVSNIFDVEMCFYLVE